jgi:hypothetical protein
LRLLAGLYQPTQGQVEADGIPIAHLDMGGGLGITYTDERPPQADELVRRLLRRLDARGHGHRELLLEPGRSLVGNAGVLVMNDVPPPAPGTVYQMWLVSPSGASLAGTMDAEAVAPSTTAVLENLGQSTKLAFTVEPASGSTRPTGQLIAELPLS